MRGLRLPLSAFLALTAVPVPAQVVVGRALTAPVSPAGLRLVPVGPAAAGASSLAPSALGTLSPVLPSVALPTPAPTAALPSAAAAVPVAAAAARAPEAAAARAAALPFRSVAVAAAAVAEQARQDAVARPGPTERDASRWSAAFDGVRPSDSAGDAAVVAAPPSARRPSLLRSAAGAMALPAGLKFLAPALPYASGAAVLAGTWLVIRGLNRALSAAAKWRGWDPATVVVARLGGEVSLWAAGGSIALRVMGSDWTTVFTSLGIGGLAVTLATKEFLGNLMRGIVLMVDSPIRIGDRILVGDKVLRVVDMTFRSIVLEEGPGEFTLMTYSGLAGQAFTVVERAPRDAAQAADRPAAPPRRRGAGFWALSAALAAGAAALGFWAPVTQPYLFGASILGATALLERLALRGLRALAEKRGWSPTGSAVTRLGATLAFYAVGVTAALATAGVPWNVLLGGATVLGVAVSVAASDIVSNLIQAVWLLLSRPFRVGDRVAVGKAEGRVVDMTLRYVVLETEPGADGAVHQVFVPYSVVAAGPLRVFRDYPTRRRP